MIAQSIMNVGFLMLHNEKSVDKDRFKPPGVKEKLV